MAASKRPTRKLKDLHKKVVEPKKAVKIKGGSGGQRQR